MPFAGEATMWYSPVRALQRSTRVKPTVYIETSVPSYYVSDPSRDIVVAAHQTITRAWWTSRLPGFAPYISSVVLEEVSLGDQRMAAKRLSVLSGMPVLTANERVENLAARYMEVLDLPPKAIRDAAHLAFACAYGLDYLVTWNCAHIANAEVIRALGALNAVEGMDTPVICTPEELMGREEL
jgi:predicted nucleic acid-binding protein